MTSLPSLKAREVVKGLQIMGFEKVRQKGSHAIFHHRDCVAVLLYPSTQVRPSVLTSFPTFSNSLRLTKRNSYEL
jgi:predicted RNA binding protein YcfA (HicA-like mRNA interferase family)